MSDHIAIEDLLADAVRQRLIAAAPQGGYALPFTPAVVDLPVLDVRDLKNLTVEIIVYESEERSQSRSGTEIDATILIAIRRKLDPDNPDAVRNVRRTVNQIREVLRRGHLTLAGGVKAAWLETGVDPISDPIALRELRVHHTNLFPSYRMSQRGS